MANVIGKTGTFNITTENPYISGYVEWQETYDTNNYISTNKSTVTIRAYLHRTNIYSGSTYITNIAGTRIAYFGSEEVKDTSNITLSIPGNTSSSGGSYIKVFEASKEITHDSNGDKTLTVGFYMTNVETGSGANAFKVAKTTSSATLTTIPRYLTINSFDITNKTETSFVVNWSVSDPRSGTYYSLDGGANWIGSATYGESLASDGKSGSFNVQGLNANTSYNIKIKIKRTDSGLWTESETKNVTTYDYPYCSDSPNFTIGNQLTLKLYNPLNRNVTVKIIGADNSTVDTWTGTGTTITGYTGASTITNLYASIPNSKSGTYKVQVVYGSSTKTRNNGNTYTIKGTETPTIGTITYEDTNSDVTAITGNNQHIVQNQSNLKVTYTSATAKNSASISKYTFTLNGVTKTSTSAGGSVDFGKVDSANDLTLTMTVTDSRGLTSSTEKTITMLEHSRPNALVTLERLNNYEDETYLTVDGSISSVNGKNTMTIKYRYKVSGGSYGDYTTIEDNAKQTLTLDKNNSYIFNVVVTDAFGSGNNKEYVLGKGVFPLFIDTELNSVGINCFPTKEKTLEVNGVDVFGTYSTNETRIDTWIDGKPIYRKVFKKRWGSITDGTDYEMATTAHNIDTVIKSYGMDFLEDGKRMPFFVPDTNGNLSKAYYEKSPTSSTGFFCFDCNISNRSSCEFIAIFEYTKTTD